MSFKQAQQGLFLTLRKVHRRDVIVGPREDPYGRVIYFVAQTFSDGTHLDVEWIECALAGTAIRVNDPEDEHADDADFTEDADKVKEMAELFEDLVGCSPFKIHKYWLRIKLDEEPWPCMACGRCYCSGRCCE